MNESVNPSDVLDELRNCEDEIPIFRIFIRCTRSIRCHSVTAENTDKKWEPLLRHITEIIDDNGEPDFGSVMAAHNARGAFCPLLPTKHESRRLSEIIMQSLKLESRNSHLLEQQYVVSDLELFQLLNTCVYLNYICSDDLYDDDPVLSSVFDIIRSNCMKYTRYSYFAHRALVLWFIRTTMNDNDETCFWELKDDLERELEAVIFSNWSNSSKHVRKLNARIFRRYLRIMSAKYDRKHHRFLIYIFDKCDKHLSWRNETRFTILVQVLRRIRNVPKASLVKKLTRTFLYKLFSALTNKSLRSAATKVYLEILGKLSQKMWMEVFGSTMKTMIEFWSSKEGPRLTEMRRVIANISYSEDPDALRALCDLWLRPTFLLYKELVGSLWYLQDETQHGYLSSYLLLSTVRLNMPQLLPQTCNADYYIDNVREATRQNIFVALCHLAEQYVILSNNKIPFFRSSEICTYPFFGIKHFLWFNVSASIAMRRCIVRSVEVMYSKILEAISAWSCCTESMADFTKWLHEFLLDCLEIGSCYQRKILALRLYKALLDFTSEDSYKIYEHREYLRNVAVIEHLRAANIWRFADKKSLYALLRLVLDDEHVIRQSAAKLILQYFEKDALSTADKGVIYKCGLLRCNSPKLPEIESGATLVKILAHWASPGETREDSSETCQTSWTNLLLDMARRQLALMKSDIPRAVAESCPFHGTLTALLAVAFRDGPESRNLTPLFTEEVLSLVKNAADFFTSALLTKSSNTEMGLAVDEHIRASETDGCYYNELQPSPAHQVLMSCIWLSLKVLCEVASEIGILMQSDAMVKSSMDIIVTVLLRCQHEDVVESAGIAVANLSRHLYGKKEYCELPKTYLMNLLEEGTGGELSHLTRRGAGLSVMFHELVVSDKRKNRPTVHFAVQKLLRSLENFSAIEMRKVEPEEDSPWARRLCFLRALVAEKEIHASLVPYMEEICLRCFDCIESDVWVVRNASLQLYGAVVPRLVGQCSYHKTSLDFADGHSFNHFITHYPMLADRMLTQLRATSKITGTSDAALRSYAKLAHTLALLSRLWTADCDLVDHPSTALIVKFRKLLYKLSEKPVLHIRQSAAKAYVALTPVTRLGSTLRRIQRTISKSKDDNFSYGLFLILRYLTERLRHDDLALGWPVLEGTKCHSFSDYRRKQADVISGSFLLKENFQTRYKDVLTAWRDMCEGKGHYKQPCYILETQFCEQQDRDCFSPPADFFHEDEWSLIERVTPSQRIQPGFFRFLSFRARFFARAMESRMRIANEAFDKSVPTITRVLNSGCTEQSIGFLTGLSQSVPLFEFMLTHLISMRDDHDPLLLEHIVTSAREMMKNVDLFRGHESRLDDLARRFCEIEASTVAANPSVIYVKYALILAFSEHETLVNDALSHVLGLCADDEGSTRLVATDYINFAFPRYARLTNGGKLTVMKCCLILLRDDVAEIRNVVSTLLQKHMIYPDLNCGVGLLKHEELVYQRFLEISIRQLLDGKLSTAGDAPKDQLANVISYFTHEIRDSADSEATIEDPFCATYKEESKFLSLCYAYMKLRASGESLFTGESFYTCYDVTRATEMSRELRQKIVPNCDDLRTVLYTTEVDYLTRKRDFVLQYLSTQAVRPSSG